MALNEADCQAMIAEVERARVKLMIAYRLHFERGNLHAVEYVNSGKLGEAKVITSVFSQQVRPGNSRLKKEVGGGAVYDLGVYCINAARYLFRAEPEEVFAWNFGRDDERFREVPATTTGLLKFSGDRLASFTCSFGVTDRSIFEVIGTKGVLKMDPAYEMVESLKTEITHGDRKERKTFPKRDQFAAELLYFSDCVLNDKKPEPSGEDGLADVRIIQALLKSAEDNRAVSLKKPVVPRRPSMRQEIGRPPVRKPPQLVNAQAPGRE